MCGEAGVAAEAEASYGAWRLDREVSNLALCSRASRPEGVVRLGGVGSQPEPLTALTGKVFAALSLKVVRYRLSPRLHGAGGGSRRAVALLNLPGQPHPTAASQAQTL